MLSTNTHNVKPGSPVLPQLNCDLGEGLDEIDAAVMPYIDQASIACGGHAGDKASMLRTLALAQAHNVQCGAHPSYPDPHNFGRRSLAITPAQLTTSLTQQVEQLFTLAQAHNTPLHYIKPHGALYNDCYRPEILMVVLKVAQHFQLPVMLSERPLPLEANDLSTDDTLTTVCNKMAVPLIVEAFADRGYHREGHLVARNQPNALLDIEHSVAQAQALCFEQKLQAIDGSWLTVACASLCVHSDTPQALQTIRAIREQVFTL